MKSVLENDDNGGDTIRITLRATHYSFSGQLEDGFLVRTFDMYQYIMTCGLVRNVMGAEPCARCGPIAAPSNVISRMGFS